MIRKSASDLEVGDRTPGGLEVVDKSGIGSTVFIKWKRGRTFDAFYHLTQELEIQTREETNMAQRVNITVESDLSGEADASTVEFGLDGQNYTIDLTDKEASKFRSLMATYVGAGAKVGKGKRRGSAASQNGAPAKVVREWAQAQGMDVPDRGRVPGEVREAYDKAH